jgi:tRNA_anti-like
VANPHWFAAAALGESSELRVRKLRQRATCAANTSTAARRGGARRELIMAIISCEECSHQVSDRAVSCPSCGAPVRSTVETKPRGRRVIPKVLITLMALWTLGTLLWLIVPRRAPDQLIALAKASFERFHRRTEQLWTTDQVRASARSQAAHRSAAEDQIQASDQASSSDQSNPPDQLATADGSVSVASRPGQPASTLRPVYETTAEQLYQDYSANVVAIQTKIGARLVRLSGSIAEIDLDVTGRPIVKLWTSKDSSAAMTLTEDQRGTAAQLAKGETVEIECDKIARRDASLEGSDCRLEFVDATPRQVNLALVLANNNGTARVYVVGPMSDAACLTSSEGISRLGIKQGNEHVVSKNCTAAARESIPPAGCHLSSSALTIPGISTAHLWRYDCSRSAVVSTSVRKKTPASSKGSAATLAMTTAPAALDANTEPESQGSAAAAPRLSQHRAMNIHIASASDSDTGAATAAPHVPVGEATVAHAQEGYIGGSTTLTLRGGPRDTTSPGRTVTGSGSDGLAQVRAVDPQAADHIATYCSKSMVSPNNQDSLVTECRRAEAQAWTRLVLKNEFPALDDATRRKCNEPPFPDTYLAKERCARYELHMN